MKLADAIETSIWVFKHCQATNYFLLSSRKKSWELLSHRFFTCNDGTSACYWNTKSKDPYVDFLRLIANMEHRYFMYEIPDGIGMGWDWPVTSGFWSQISCNTVCKIESEKHLFVHLMRSNRSHTRCPILKEFPIRLENMKDRLLGR